MKLICDRAALQEAVTLAAGVVVARTPRPQLTCIKLTSRKTGKGGAGTITLAATDAEISLRLSRSDVEVQEEGEALVPADKLRSIVGALDDQPTLTLKTDGDVIAIEAPGAHFKVYGMPAADFPPVAEFPAQGAHRFAIDADMMAQLIQRTIFSTARDNSRYAINGVLLKRQGKKLEMVATDGRRLALARGVCEPLSAGDDGAHSCIIPTKALNMVSRLMTGGVTRVRIAITDNQVFFAFDQDKDAPAAGGTLLSSNLLEGTFPPYEEVIPKDQDKKATFDVQVLNGAVRRAALLTNEESRGVKMSFSSGKGPRLKVKSSAPESGEAEIEVDMKAYDGGDIDISFNPAFITDALKVVDGESVLVELKAPNKPGLIRSGNDFVYVVMPVNLS